MKAKIFAVILALAIVWVMFSGYSGSGDGNKPPAGLKENPASDFDYKYVAAQSGIKITKYTGTSIRVRIPEKIEGEPVTVIKSAFSGSGIIEVYIPNSVTSIGYEAFSGCTGLTSVTYKGNIQL